MAVSTHKILCGSCKSVLEGPTEPKPDDVVTCAGCGQHDTFQNVMAEVKQYVVDRTAKMISDSMANAVRGSKFIKVTSKPGPQRSYRFIAEMGA